MAETKAKTAEAKEEAEKMVTIRLPRLGAKDDAQFVRVNERTWLIKRGVDVEVPECVAEVLRHAEQAEEEYYEFVSGNTK